MNMVKWVGVFFIVLILAGCAGVEPTSKSALPSPSASSAGGEATFPGYPEWETRPRSLGVGSGGQLWIGASEAVQMIHAAPAEKGLDLIYRSSHNEGHRFGHDLRINLEAGEVSAHGENDPQLRMGPGIGIFTLWQGKGDLKFSRSMSFGHSFQPPVRVNDDTGDNSHSFFTMEVSPRGEIYAAWLDSRDKATEPPGHSSLYIARSTDQGATFSKNVKVAGNICPCCRTSMTFGSDGTVYLAWRRVYPGHDRRVVVASSKDGGATWSEPVPVTAEGWKINGCPHSGPVLGMADGRLTVAWYSAADNTPRLLMAQSTDGGITFSPAREIQGPVLDANHPHLTVLNGEIWILFQGRHPEQEDGWGPARPWLVRVSNTGEAGVPQPLPAMSDSVAYPRLFPGNGGRLYAVWTEYTDQGPQVVMCRGRLGLE